MKKSKVCLLISLILVFLLTISAGCALPYIEISPPQNPPAQPAPTPTPSPPPAPINPTWTPPQAGNQAEILPIPVFPHAAVAPLPPGDPAASRTQVTAHDSRIQAGVPHGRLGLNQTLLYDLGGGGLGKSENGQKRECTNPGSTRLYELPSGYGGMGAGAGAGK